MLPNVQKKVLKRKLNRFKDNELRKPKKIKEVEEREEKQPEDVENDEENVEESEAQEQKTSDIEVSNVTAKSVLTDVTFDSFEGRLHPKLLEAVKKMGFTYMTEIQAKCIDPLLQGHDILGLAKTGSGKTLAFLLPAIQLLLKLKWQPYRGTGVVVIAPTRELAMQTYGVLNEIMEFFPSLTHGLVMGGANRETEARKLLTGVCILVATPGRLLDHLQDTKGFVYKYLSCLIIDEADRILDIGFELDIKRILRILPKKRQSMLFSATTGPKVDDLIKTALHANPFKIEIKRTEATVSGLQQGYVICESDQRFLLLFTFLKKNKGKKIMVFFSSCSAVKYYNELLNFIDLPVQSIHGKQKQSKRTTTYFKFCNDKTGILLCTDVAARGLDIPKVDWIVQYDPPDDPREYIHRVGRTARGEDGIGSALLFLRPEELEFLRYLKAAKVNLDEYEFSKTKMANIQPQLEKLIRENYYLNIQAKEAYKSYVRAYISHSLKQIFDVHSLDLLKVAKSFGFDAPPFVDLPTGHRNKFEGREKSTSSKIRSFKKFRNQAY
uniref:ATP-dependent RNA helicase n=1 Tax=Panagrolaimus sp. JU765 TaxID=591449 RepID=A0AC34R685_9BILA